MDTELRDMAAQLQRMSSTEAADWLMNKFPIDGEYGRVFSLLTHRSWLRPDQRRLADYYLQRIPFATARPYEAFASFMSLQQLTDVLKAKLPLASERMDLLRYHLEPVLRKLAKADSDLRLIEQLLRPGDTS
jgi:hypothetical protein